MEKESKNITENSTVDSEEYTDLSLMNVSTTKGRTHFSFTEVNECVTEIIYKRVSSGAKPKAILGNFHTTAANEEAGKNDSKASQKIDDKNVSWVQLSEDLIRKTVEIAQANVNCIKAEQISVAVFECVKTILHNVSEEDSRFKISELLKVGGFYEGTKVVEPDEFDFLAVIEELSRPGAVTVVTDDIRPGYAEVLLADKSLKERWMHTEKSNALHNFHEYERPRSFSSVVLFVLAKMADEQSLEYEFDKELGYIDLKGTPISFPTIENISLTLTYADEWNPNSNIRFLYDGMVINVDISPAIRYHKIEECFKPEDCISTQLADDVFNRGSILLVNYKTWDSSNRDPAHEHVFKITFTETEVRLLKHMRRDHKRIYIFFKYLSHVSQSILKTFGVLGGLKIPSYLLKTACLFHDQTCKESELIPSSFCLYKILLVFSKWCQSHEYRSIFNTKLLVCSGKNHINDNRRMFDFLFDLCANKIDITECTDTHFNPASFFETKMKDFYTGNHMSSQRKDADKLLPLFHFMSCIENKEVIIHDPKSKGVTSDSIQKFFTGRNNYLKAHL